MLLKNLEIPIILIGFMGTGKTTVGQYLMNQLHLSYIDLDDYIEKEKIILFLKYLRKEENLTLEN